MTQPVTQSKSTSDILDIGDQNLTHESKIPPIVSKIRNQFASAAHALPRTPLSFALPSSLAFFKRLTWELIPRTRPPIDAAVATAIAARFPPETITAAAISHAFCLGVGFTDTSYGAKDHLPHLYVVFPKLRRDVRDDIRFLSAWHDGLLKPAFDEAWIDSGLVDVWENTIGGTTWSTTKAAPAAATVFDRFYNATDIWMGRPQHKEWPKWNDPWVYSHPQSPEKLSQGMEGGYSDARARVLIEAWSSIQDMLKGWEGQEMSEPILLAIWRKEFHADDETSLVQVVGKEWDAFVDSRFVEPGKFVVHLGQNKQHDPYDQQDQRGQQAHQCDDSLRPDVADGLVGRALKMLWR
ncbi:hypothetical protein BU23DRAFT_548321 [Bimuria novae-zelandiae CBS 107.79]|uniref:Uncharacterized protein n=1 Tax=Bimuria novae-zelandiae CBS 107.79 TaxID=1447943 RepID=A0A6A5VZ10_9PLEO|nr:hypothetical protein BU23DRAFT_548321 [Bimuria novae-zelandiae CBS 107.79]